MHSVLVKLAKHYVNTISILTLCNFNLALEEFLVFCVKNKQKYIKFENEIIATVKVFDKNSNLSYLSYYFLDIADTNLSKEEVCNIEVFRIFEDIYKNKDISNKKVLDKLLGSILNFPFYRCYFSSFLTFAFQKGIKPGEILDKIGFKHRFQYHQYRKFLINLLFYMLKGENSDDFKLYFQEVFASERDIFLSLLKNKEYSFDCEERREIANFFYISDYECRVEE